MGKNKKLLLLLLVIQGACNNFRCSSTNRTGSVFLVAAKYNSHDVIMATMRYIAKGRNVVLFVTYCSIGRSTAKSYLLVTVLSRTYAVCSTSECVESYDLPVPYLYQNNFACTSFKTAYKSAWFVYNTVQSRSF